MGSGPKGSVSASRISCEPILSIVTNDVLFVAFPNPQMLTSAAGRSSCGSSVRMGANIPGLDRLGVVSGHHPYISARLRATWTHHGSSPVSSERDKNSVHAVLDQKGSRRAHPNCLHLLTKTRGRSAWRAQSPQEERYLSCKHSVPGFAEQCAFIDCSPSSAVIQPCLNKADLKNSF